MSFSFIALFIRKFCVIYIAAKSCGASSRKLVKCIRARGLQYRQFIAFLEETDAYHQDLLYHCRVRWLSLGEVFQRMWELKEITAFLELMERSDEFPELSDKTGFVTLRLQWKYIRT